MRRRVSPGFSLPEVTMAVGIAAMAIVLLLGLVPTGLTSIRDAGNTLAEARIFQQIVGEIQGSDWGSAGSSAGSADPLSYSLLRDYNGSRRFFDDQGTPLDQSQSRSARLAYVARIALNQAGAVAVPGGQPSQNMVAVTVDVASVPDPDFGFPPNIPFTTRSFVVARQY